MVARKLFTKTESVTSISIPTSPELISSEQETTHDSQQSVKVEESITVPINQSVASLSTSCSQDMFDNIELPTPCDITPSLTSSPVIAHLHNGPVTTSSEEKVVTEPNALLCNNTCVDNKNSGTPYHKPDSEVQVHTSDVKLTSIGSSAKCKPHTTDQKSHSNVSHNRDDVMDELFADHLTQEHSEKLLQEEEHKLIHSKPIAHHTDSGYGDDVIHKGVIDHVISDEKLSAATPIISANDMHHSTLHHSLRQGSIKKSKQFKAPRVAKKVGEDEKKKLLEQYSKKFPSLAVNDNMRRSVASDVGFGGVVSNNVGSGGLISCGFTSAGSGKKFTVSAAALQHAVRLVDDDYPTDWITGQYAAICSHGNPTHNDTVDHGEEAKMFNNCTETTKVETSSCTTENKASLECVKEERSHETSKGSHELVEGLENIDMEQFSAFTQMPGYIRAVVPAADDNDQLSAATAKQTSDHVWTPTHQSSISPIEKVSSYITPGGSFNPCPSNFHNNDTTPCKLSVDGHDDDELKRMFNTQVIKQFLDFNSSNDDDDGDDDDDDGRMTSSMKLTDQLQYENSCVTSHAHDGNCATMCDSHTHNESCNNDVGKNITSSDDHIQRSHTNDPTHKGLHDTNNPTHTDHAAAMPDNRVFGLATASGKSVTLSTDAISKVKKLLDDKCKDDMNTRPFPGLSTASGNVVNISDHSLQAVKQLFSDDKMSLNVDAVANGNHTHNNTKAIVDVETDAVQEDDNDVEMMSLNKPSCEELNVHRSSDPISDTTVTMETANVTTNVSFNQ